jgi:hypothetical protein
MISAKRFMTNRIPFSTLLGLLLSVSCPAYAQTAKAPCISFQKLPDGNWSVAKAIKIEHGHASAILNPGKIISPGTQAAGVDVYAALQKNCQAGSGTGQ